MVDFFGGVEVLSNDVMWRLSRCTLPRKPKKLSHAHTLGMYHEQKRVSYNRKQVVLEIIRDAHS